MQELPCIVGNFLFNILLYMQRPLQLKVVCVLCEQNRNLEVSLFIIHIHQSLALQETCSTELVV